MTYEDFLKTFIEGNKSNVTRDRLFGGYDILKYDYDKMNTEFPRPDINSEEYHDYYRKMMVMKVFGDAFQRYTNKLTYLPKPPITEVYHGQLD